MPSRVLLIQSDPASTQVLARFFKERGDSYWAANDLAQGEALLEQRNPDLLLLDLHFPGTEWLSLLRKARQRSPELKIILTNKYPDLQREILAAEAGVNVFLRQPYTRTWIENAISRATSKAEGKEVESARQPLPRVKMPVRFKITLPYLLLALIFAMASAYIVSQVVTDSVRDRYLTQLMESGRQTADWMVREESRLLESLRLVSNTQGLAEAIRARDAEAVRALALPIAVNAGEEDIEVLDPQATTLLSMRLKAGGGPGDYEFARAETFLQAQGFVRQTLLSGADQNGDKYAGVAMPPSGDTFYVSGPVYAADGSIAGVVLVGKTLKTLVRQASQDTLAEVTLYDLSGAPLASTIFTSDGAQPLPVQQANQVIASQDSSSLTRSLDVTQIDYTEVLGPWEARNGLDLGLKGTALTNTFLVTTTNTTQLQIFVVVALAILLVVGVGLFLASRITRPIVRLANASSEVAQGNLEVKVDSSGNDEVAVLAHAFNSMVAGLQEGSVYRDLLGRTVSPEVRDQLRQTFTSGNLRLEGQQAVATILMTDIRGFTTLSEKEDPAAVLNWLNEYFSLLVPIVTAHGGVVNKFDGDAMLAFFGILPRHLSPKLGARSACEAALEMLKAINRLNNQRAGRGEPLLVTGIGINSGVVIAGGLGSNDRLHYTIIGDSVNTTQRLESLTRQLYTTSGVLISQATYLALAENAIDFHLEPAGTYAVKGKSEQVQVYRLLSNEVQVPEVML